MMIRRFYVGWASPTIKLRPSRLVGSAHPTGGFTLVEMLVAMAITLVMMAAVVTLFANVSNSVRNQRANLELMGQVRQVRNALQQDLQGATCPGLTWQRPESNHGYIEYIEGQYREGNATNLIDADPNNPGNPPNWPPSDINPEINHALSTLPSSNLPFKDPSWATDGGGLGDYDDILMLTVRNEHKPLVGRMPKDVTRASGAAFTFNQWGTANVESPMAEVVWFAIENPGYEGDPNDPTTPDPTVRGFFGEPGMRTIYRRTLLIAPWLNPYQRVNPQNGQTFDTFTHDGQTFKAEPGLLRMLPKNIALEEAIAAVIAFQDRYDLSVRLEWDPNTTRWKIMANTLADLTKRENRFGHFGYLLTNNNQSRRVFPYPLVSTGDGYGGSQAGVEFVVDPEIGPPGNDAKAIAHIDSASGGKVLAYSIDAPLNYTDPARQYAARPFAFVDDDAASVPATAQAVLNDDGAVVRVLHGPVPLWGARRGEDVMLTNVLAFDVRAFDPGAPLFRHLPTDTMLSPSDPGWRVAYSHSDNTAGGVSSIGRNNTNSRVEYPYVGQGAYVDLGYGFPMPAPAFYSPDFSSSAEPWFFAARALSDVYGNQLAPGYSVYDTWSFHYENNGVDDDADGVVDQGTDGLDGVGRYANPAPPPLTVDATRLGVDDVGERETAPPYDKPLRGVQVILRAYERDSRGIRQVRVNQHFMPE